MNGYKHKDRKKWVYAWKNGDMLTIPLIAYIDNANNVYEKEDKDRFVRIGTVKKILNNHEVIYE